MTGHHHSTVFLLLALSACGSPVSDADSESRDPGQSKKSQDAGALVRDAGGEETGVEASSVPVGGDAAAVGTPSRSGSGGAGGAAARDPGAGAAGGAGGAVPEPLPPSGDWDPYCLKELFPGYPVEVSDPNCYVQSALFQCAEGAQSTPAPARLRRITRDEMVRASGFKLSDDVAKNPFEAPAHAPYSTYDEGVSIDPVTLDLYLSTLHLPGAGWASGKAPRISYTYYYGGGGGPPVDSCIFEEAEPDAACRDGWVRQFLKGGLLFRTPTEEEVAFFADVLDGALAEEGDPTTERQATLTFVTSAAWLSPEALFRGELGGSSPEPGGHHRLSVAEMAKQLAYMLGNRGPGAPASHTSTGGFYTGWSNSAQGERVPYGMDIAGAAESGRIFEPEVLDTLVRANFGGDDPERPDLRIEENISRIERRGRWHLAPKVRDFFREWLGYMSAASAFKDTPAATSTYTAEGYDLSQWDGLEANSWANPATRGYLGNLGNSPGDNESTLTQQMDDLIARVVMQDTAALQQLLTTRTYRLPSTRSGGSCSSNAECTEGNSRCLNGRCYGSTWLGHRFAALVYGVPGHIEETIDVDDDPRWVEMAAGDRAGVLTHPAWLAAHGDNFEDGQSAILRGRWIREQLLCQHVPPLSKVPAGVEVKLPQSHPDLSARRRIGTATDNAFCGACHERMNPLGLPFEQYNHAGFVRAWDRSEDPNVAQGPVDSSTQLSESGTDGALPDPELNGRAFSSATEMLEAFASSVTVKQCFVRQAFRFFMGRDEGVEDACTLSQMEQAYDQKGSFQDMLVALAQSNTFQYRARPETQMCQ